MLYTSVLPCCRKLHCVAMQAMMMHDEKLPAACKQERGHLVVRCQVLDARCCCCCCRCCSPVASLRHRRSCIHSASGLPHASAPPNREVRARRGRTSRRGGAGMAPAAGRCPQTCSCRPAALRRGAGRGCPGPETQPRPARCCGWRRHWCCRWWRQRRACQPKRGQMRCGQCGGGARRPPCWPGAPPRRPARVARAIPRLLVSSLSFDALHS